MIAMRGPPGRIKSQLRLMKSTLLPLLFASISLPLCFAGELKVDLNRDSRNTVTETEPGYTRWVQPGNSWAISGTNTASQSFTTATGENVTITFAQTALSQSRGGTGLLSNWYQVGAQGAAAKLVSDGITVAPANMATGGEIVMTITGLAAGTHTLLTYHNAWDNLAAGSMGPMDVFVNGVEQAGNLTPAIRAAVNSAAPVSYVEFEVTGPAAVTAVLFSAETTGPAVRKNVCLNGFEIDTPNATRVARNPVPANGDAHVNADAGSVSFGWAAPQAGTVSSYEIFASTDYDAVRYPASGHGPLIGSTTGTVFVWPGVTSVHANYFWRVDVLDNAGNRTRGVVWSFQPRRLAFPGVEGWGRFARGGRGGRVVKVTSLADYASGEAPLPGTLRYAVEVETGARTIVFDVAGLITLTRRITVNINQPSITIAGQTAPGKGICIRNFPLGASGARDLIVRFIRNRVGNLSGQTLDGGGLGGCDHSIMDHCSISWGQDEEFSSRNAHNITLQRTLISEALNIAGHQNYPAGTRHGYAASIGGDVGSFHHNLLAHCEGRNWSMAGGLDGANFFKGRLDIRNNVVYNWRSRTTDGGAMEVNFVGNYYRPGAATELVPWALTMNHEDNFAGSQRCYFSGNVMPGHFDENTQTAGRRSVVSSGVPTPAYETFVSAPFFDSFVTTHTAGQAFRHVLCDTGCNQPQADDHDIRVIQETRDGTTTYTGSVSGESGLPDSQVDVGGWENYGSAARPANFDTDGDGLPDEWETAHGLNPGAENHNADPDNDGYTQLEDYLNFLSSPHASTAEGAAVDIPLLPYGRGMTAPVFAVNAPVNGTVMLLPGGTAARFTPAAGFTGRARFSFTVTGHGVVVPMTMTVLVTSSSSMPPPDVSFLSIQISGGALTCSVNSQPGFLYQLQVSETLTEGTWINSGSAKAGTGSPVIFTDTTAAAGGRKFYRVAAVRP
jgi:Bacterial Ig domain